MQETTRRDMTCKPMLMVMDLLVAEFSRKLFWLSATDFVRPEPIGPKLFILGEPVLKTGQFVVASGECRPM